MKTCTKCRIEKPLHDFYKKATTKDGYQYCCKECKSGYNTDHYSRNKEYYSEKRKRNQRIYIDRNLEYIRNYLSTRPCVDCGEADIIVLQFDHRDRADKRYNISE